MIINDSLKICQMDPLLADSKLYVFFELFKMEEIWGIILLRSLQIIQTKTYSKKAGKSQ